MKKLNNTHPLQSKEWGEFRKAWGNEILWTDYGILTLHKIPFTKYKIGMFIKGPEPSKEMLTKLRRIGKEHHLIFIKLEPSVPVSINQKPTSFDRQKLSKLLRSSGATP